MKKENRKTNKKLMAAFSMLLVSAAMLGTATYAWFTMNKTVEVTGMKLKATAEDGLVISDYTKDDWATSWVVTMSQAAKLAPTSTTDGTDFVSATSRYFENADKNQDTSTGAGGYTDLSLNYDKTVYGEAGTALTSTLDEGIGYVTDSNSVRRNYVLLRKFFIKSTGDTDWNTPLVIDEVTAETTTTNSEDLNKSLRVLVKVGSKSFIYAPITGYDDTCKYKGTTALTLISSTTDSTTAATPIPAGNTTTPIEVSMYMYFEGEDANCKSENISGITVDDITISAKFKTGEGPADPANP